MINRIPFPKTEERKRAEGERPKATEGSVPSTKNDMLRNYIKIAFRNLTRHRGSAVLNVFGLAVGLASALLIFLFVREEVRYDRFHEEADRVFRVTYEEVNTPAMRHLPTISPPMGPALAEEYPEIEAFLRLRDSDRHLLAYGDRHFYESTFFYADSTFFDFFSFPLQQGNPATALDAADSIVLTAETARRYFGGDDPLGQVMMLDGERALTVTGVLAPDPGPSHLRFDFLLSFATFRVPTGYPVTLESWSWISFFTYVRLADGADPAALEAKLPLFLARHFDDDRASNVRLRLQPVTDIYLGQPTDAFIAAGSPAYVYGLSGIAVLMLLLAGFNFTNLATAHALRRSKEVSVRKVLGARRRTLIGQFLGESVLAALLALLLAVVLVEITLKSTGGWIDWGVTFTPGDYLLVLPLFAGLAFVLGIAAGSYPAFILARFELTKGLKGGGTVGAAGAGVRRALVTAQFAIAITLIAGTLVVARQMDYVQQKALGFDKEAVVAFHMPGDDLLPRYPALRERLLQNPNVVSVSKGGGLFDGYQGSVPIFPEGADDQEPHAMNLFGVHYDFVETLGLNVVAGRAHDEAFATDSSSGILLNETAARLIAATVPGWEDPLGKRLQVGGIIEGEVIGVLEDFHFASLHDAINPLVLYIPPTAMEHVFVRIRPGNAEATLASLRETWQAVVPDFPFAYTFLDERIDQLYRADQRFARLVTAFSFLTILVACLGLYGLVAFTTELRTKEIGLRKVLGASVPGLVGLLSLPFLRRVALAGLLAGPPAYFALNRWLEGFAYRIDVTGAEFLAATALALLIAFLTMSHRAVRAALTNPVDSLRYE